MKAGMAAGRSDMSRAKIAAAKFNQDYNCAQSVFSGFVEELEISAEAAMKVAGGFGGGMARNQEVCGAVTGGIMVLGLLHGRSDNDSKNKNEVLYPKVQEFMRRFEEEFGSVHCRRLLEGYDLLTVEGREKFKRDNLNERCRLFVCRAVEIIEELSGAGGVPET
jgi:C_GCAxxG_C_C family probable redox protein